MFAKFFCYSAPYLFLSMLNCRFFYPLLTENIILLQLNKTNCILSLWFNGCYQKALCLLKSLPHAPHRGPCTLYRARVLPPTPQYDVTAPDVSGPSQAIYPLPLHPLIQCCPPRSPPALYGVVGVTHMCQPCPRGLWEVGNFMIYFAHMQVTFNLALKKV